MNKVFAFFGGRKYTLALLGILIAMVLIIWNPSVDFKTIFSLFGLPAMAFIVFEGLKDTVSALKKKE